MSQKYNKAIKLLSEKAKKPEVDNLSFQEFIEKILTPNPKIALRNVFQICHDAIMSQIDEAHDDFQDENHIGYGIYDATRLLEDNTNTPFVASRQLTHNLVRFAEDLKFSTQQNKIYIIFGPPGSGKSTFLNNLLKKIQKYTSTAEGAYYTPVWKIESTDSQNEEEENSLVCFSKKKNILEIPCPRHCHPITTIPTEVRDDFLKSVLTKKDYKYITESKECEWIWQWKPCTICKNIYNRLLRDYNSHEKALSQLYIERYVFDRQTGNGITIYNPGDRSMLEKGSYLTNKKLQERIDECFGDSMVVRYNFSHLAGTNNGIYVLMDIKQKNVDRLKELHNIISEGTIKVGKDEESVSSLFVGVMNPEDRKVIEKMRSFDDRIYYFKVPYICDIDACLKMYYNAFGKDIENNFLPKILANFARIIISTRLKEESEAIFEWLGDLKRYTKYCNANPLLIKMEILRNTNIPWLSSEDKKRFTKEKRYRLINELEKEEDEVQNTPESKSVSGRQEQKILSAFLVFLKNKQEQKEKGEKRTALGTIDDLIDFFLRLSQNTNGKINGDLESLLNKDFLTDLRIFYDYQVLQEVKEALYYYNEKQIKKDILHYLSAINHDIGQEVFCASTNEKFIVSKQFFDLLEEKLFPRKSKNERQTRRLEEAKTYRSITLAQEIQIEGKSLEQTKQFKKLFDRYTKGLKENVLEPLKDNDNFKRAIMEFGSKEFEVYDKRLQADVKRLIANLQEKFGYNEEGAKEICLYVIENELWSI